MLFTLLFVIWTCVLLSAWLAARIVTLAMFAVALVITLALFLHHMTDPLTLSF